MAVMAMTIPESDAVLARLESAATSTPAGGGYRARQADGQRGESVSSDVAGPQRWADNTPRKRGGTMASARELKEQKGDLFNEFCGRFYDRGEPFTEDAARAEFLLNYPDEGLDSGGDPGHHQTLREVVVEIRRILEGGGATWSKEEITWPEDVRREHGWA
jgi:hypothetical protein